MIGLLIVLVIVTGLVVGIGLIIWRCRPGTSGKFDITKKKGVFTIISLSLKPTGLLSFDLEFVHKVFWLQIPNHNYNSFIMHGTWC